MKTVLVTVVALLTLLPRFGIAGAAMASLLGYSVMMIVAFIALMHQRERSMWSYLKPRTSDLPLEQLRSLWRVRMPAAEI